MSKWRIDPAGVQRVLDTVAPENETLHGAISDTSLDACFTGLSGGGMVTSAVPEALNRLIEDQSAHLSTIVNGVGAALLGVANATTAYNQGQEEMIGTFQSKAASAAEDGDFTYFDDHGLI